MKEPRSLAVPVLVAALALLGTGSGPARAEETGPSFDCAKAATPVEKTICKDEFLGFRDGALGRLYSGLQDALTGQARGALRREQIAWLKARGRACGKVGEDARSNCLTKLYDERLGALNRRMGRAGLGPGARGLASVAGRYRKSATGFSGDITIVEMPKGPAWVEIFTIAGPTAHFCTLSTKQARRTGATLSWRDSEEPKCSVSLTFKGGTVRAKATEACRTYCGARGYFEDITYSKTRR
jgi:uncharacterized protein